MDCGNELTAFDVCCHLVAEYLRRKYERGDNFVNIHELRGLLSVDFGSDSPVSAIVMEMVVCGYLVCGNPSLDRCGFWILRSVRDVPFLVAKVDETDACLEHRQAERYDELNRERLLALERWQHGTANVTTQINDHGRGGKADEAANLTPDQKAGATNAAVPNGEAGDGASSTPVPNVVPATNTKRRKPLQKCEWQVYFAHRYAELKMNEDLEAPESYRYWCEHGFDPSDSEIKNAEAIKDFDPQTKTLKSYAEQLARALTHPDINERRNEVRKYNQKGQKRRNGQKMSESDEK